jgi:hypothetical protein
MVCLGLGDRVNQDEVIAVIDTDKVRICIIFKILMDFETIWFK